MIKKDKSYNVCKQIHTANEYGFKFIPLAEKTGADYLGRYPDWLDYI